MLLLDFEDSGNAAATSVPRNMLTVQIAPLNFAFETIAGNERMNIIMNHELVHVVTMDQATRRDRTFRRLFGGKVVPVAGAARVDPLLLPDHAARGGAALVSRRDGRCSSTPGWPAASAARRAATTRWCSARWSKDGTPFYDPLGLVSEGTKIDFQLQVNSYLYGTRFMTWLARNYSPEQAGRVGRAARDGSRAYYATQFRHVFGTSIEEAWARWVADERAFQTANLEAIRKYPLTPSRDLTPRALGSVSRAYYDDRDEDLYAAFNYPGVVAHVGAISTETGAVERLVGHQGPDGVHGDVARLGSRSRHAVLHDRQRRVPRSGAARSGDAGRHAAAEGCAHRRPGVRSRPMARSGASATERAVHAGADCRRRTREWTQVLTFPYGTVMYDLDVSPDGTRLVGIVRRDQRQAGRARASTSTALCKRRRLTPVAEFDFGTVGAERFVFSPDGRYLYGSSYFTGVSNIFRYEIATRRSSMR